MRHVRGYVGPWVSLVARPLRVSDFSQTQTQPHDSGACTLIGMSSGDAVCTRHGDPVRAPAGSPIPATPTAPRPTGTVADV